MIARITNAGSIKATIGATSNVSATINTNVSIVDKLKHYLKIGTYVFDGSQNVEVPVYDGKLNDEDSSVMEYIEPVVEQAETMTLSSTNEPETMVLLESNNMKMHEVEPILYTMD